MPIENFKSLNGKRRKVEARFHSMFCSVCFCTDVANATEIQVDLREISSVLVHRSPLCCVCNVPAFQSDDHPPVSSSPVL